MLLGSVLLALVGWLLPSTLLTTPTGLLTLVLVPGYCWSTLLPGVRCHRGATRLLVAVGVGLLGAALVAGVLAISPWGLAPEMLVTGLATWAAFSLLVSWASVPARRSATWRPWLVAEPAIVAALAVLSTSFALLSAPAFLRIPFGLAAVLVLPGYAITLAAFPRVGELDWVGRIALSLALSFAATVIVVVGLDATPWGLSDVPTKVMPCLLTVVAAGLASWRQHRLQPAERASMISRGLDLGRGPRQARIVLATLIAVMLLAVVVLVASVLAPVDRGTELYVLGSDGQAERYPRNIGAGQSLVVTVGIVSHEPRETTFRLTERHDGFERELRVVPLAPGETWQDSVQFPAPTVERPDQPIEILLYRPDRSEPHRQLRLWLNVRPAETAR